MRLGTWALWALLLAAPAAAHRLSPAYFGLTETAPDVFAARFKVSVSGGLADALSPQIPDACRISAPVRTYTIDDARVQIGAIDCSETGLRGAELRVAGLERTDTDVLLRVDYLDGSSYTHRLVPDAPSVTIPERAGRAEVAATYLGLGVEHILLGVDHLMFVLALMLLVDGIGRLVATITAFTIAHSITLASATLGLVAVPSKAVEATIALSILFVATELARREFAEFGVKGFGVKGDLATRFPWLVAFTFGLLHGFGFAGALSAVGLPDAAIPLALAFFNVGVEIGQLAFVGLIVAAGAALAYAAVPVPVLLRRATIYGIGCTSAFWVIERSL